MIRASKNHSPTRSGLRRSSDPALCVTRNVSVIEGHALWARSYDLTPNPLLALEERTLDPVLSGAQDKFVVDVACGTGRWLHKLKARGAKRGLGVDLSAEMLEQASRKPLLNGSLIRGHACALPIPNTVADFVMTSFAVGYIEDLRAFARELARVSRPYGLVVVSDFHPANHFRRWRRTFRCGSQVYEIRSFARPMEQVCDEFGKCGLKLEMRLEPCFGEPERPIFDAYGKDHLFQGSRAEPAIFVCIFRRIPETLTSDNAG